MRAGVTKRTNRPGAARMRAALVAVALLAGACSGDDAGDVAADVVDGAIDQAEGALDDAVEDFEEGMEDALADADPDEGPLEPFDPEAAESGGGDDPAPPAAVDAPPATPEPAAPPASEAPANPPPDAEASTPAPGVPSAGDYAYDRTVTDEDGTRTEDASAVVERLSGDDVSAQLRITLENEEGSIANDAFVDPNGVVVQRSVLSSPLGEIDCDWNPDWTLQGRWQAGEAWTFATSCADSSGTFTLGVDLSGSGTVVGTESITVAGVTYDAWVVDTTTTTDVTVTSPTVSGSSTTETTTRAWVDPATGMQVRSESTDVTTGDFGNTESSATTELRSFTAA